jgi:hypothetical protein
MLNKLTDQERMYCMQNNMYFRCREKGSPSISMSFKQPGPCDSAALGSKPELQINLTSTVVEDPCECIVIDVTIAGQQARTLVDSGANACFVSAAFCSKSGICYHCSCHRFASLGDGQQSATSWGEPIHLNYKPNRSKPQRYYKFS